MKQFLLTVAGVFVGLMLFMVGAPILLIALAVNASKPAPTPAHTVLVLDLRGGLSDQDPQGLALFSGRPLSVMSVEATLKRAAADGRVKGLFVRLPDGGMEPAAADELRAAFKQFRASGKPIIAHSQGLYQQGMITSTYELGAASGDLWMQPGAPFQATGVSVEDIFFKRFFDKYGIKADYEQRYEFKNAVNPYLYSDYTPAHRLSELSWMGSVYETALTAAAADRNKAPADLRTIIEAGPYSAEDAKAKGLIDQVGEVKAAQRAILKAAGADAKFMNFGLYAARNPPSAPIGAGPTVALIQAEGDIVTGAGGRSSPFSSSQDIYSDDLSDAIFQAVEDTNVKAIVLRVSSPGGSDTASEQILSAVRAAKAAGKPLVVSMGTYAASGGYWISSQASEIVAEPSTLTGSIGVYGGKFALSEALSRFGVDMRHIKVGGDFADANGSDAAMTPTQKAAFAAWMDRIYNGFVARVAEGRKLPVERVQAIARGRVWTGVQAKALGLVDELGGLPLAIERAKALAGLKGEVRIKSFGTGGSPFGFLGRLFGAGTQDARTLSDVADLARDPAARELIAQLHDARLRQAGAAVLAPRMLP